MPDQLGPMLEREMLTIRSPEYVLGDVARRRDRRRRNRRLGTAILALVVAAAAFAGLARAFSRVGSKVPGRTRSNGTITFSRQLDGSAPDFMFRMAPDGSGLEAMGIRMDGVALSPDGTHALFPDCSSPAFSWCQPAIMGVDGSGRRIVPVADASMTGLWPAGWSPDGTRLLVGGFDDADPSRDGIYTERASDGGDLVQVTNNPRPGSDIPLSYSPDGSRILFARTIGQVFGGAQDLDVVNVDGSGLRQLNPTGTAIRPWDPSNVASLPGNAMASWSPNGSSVTFIASRGLPREVRKGGTESALFIARADGTGVRRLTPWGDVRDAAWSPDGTWIAFSRSSAGVGDIYVIHPDGSGIRAVTSAPDGLSSSGAVWSSDGTKLLFVRNPDGGEFHSDLWIANVDGTGLTQVTHQTGQYWMYSWSANPD